MDTITFVWHSSPLSAATCSVDQQQGEHDGGPVIRPCNNETGRRSECCSSTGPLLDSKIAASISAMSMQTHGDGTFIKKRKLNSKLKEGKSVTKDLGSIRYRPSAQNAYRFFGPQVDESALHYCQLANDMLHELNPDVITIADDVRQDGFFPRFQNARNVSVTGRIPS